VLKWMLCWEWSLSRIVELGFLVISRGIFIISHVQNYEKCP
jgi:hypothetical protein